MGSSSRADKKKPIKDYPNTLPFPLVVERCVGDEAVHYITLDSTRTRIGIFRTTQKSVALYSRVGLY